MARDIENDKNISFPPALERAIEILEFLSASPASSFSVKEISYLLNIPYASAYRIIKCLEYNEFLVPDLSHKDRYKLGYKIFAIGKSALGHNDFVAIADPYLTDLSQRFKQSTKLSSLTETAVITLVQILPKEGITLISKLGEERPVNASASGKILTSLLTRQQRQPYLLRALSMNRDVLLERYASIDGFNDYLDNVCIDGYGLDMGEHQSDIGCVAVPIFDYTNKPIAAISFSGLISYYSDQSNLEEMVNSLKNVSLQISQKLGYSGDIV